MEDIPPNFRDIVVPVDPLPVESPRDVVGPGYRIVAKPGGWHDVVDAHGKRLNEKALRQPEAQTMLDNLLA